MGLRGYENTRFALSDSADSKDTKAKLRIES